MLRSNIVPVGSIFFVCVYHQCGGCDEVRQDWLSSNRISNLLVSVETRLWSHYRKICVFRYSSRLSTRVSFWEILWCGLLHNSWRWIKSNILTPAMQARSVETVRRRLHYLILEICALRFLLSSPDRHNKPKESLLRTQFSVCHAFRKTMQQLNEGYLRNIIRSKAIYFGPIGCGRCHIYIGLFYGWGNQP